jgi:hypothetical protein
MSAKTNAGALAAALALFLSAGVGAEAQDAGCPEGTYNVTIAPDGATLAILFDGFLVEAGGPTGVETATKVCQLSIPLQLPPQTSIGVYKVDYRGYALLDQQQQFELTVVYGLGARDHSFRRQMRSQHEGEFVYSQTIGAGLIRRVGCGEDAVLNVEATISLNTNRRPGYALAALDSVDGAPRGGLIYYFEYRSCR